MRTGVPGAWRRLRLVAEAFQQLRGFAQRQAHHPGVAAGKVLDEHRRTTLDAKAWLTLRAPDRYLYRVHLETDLSVSGQAPLKTYASEGEAFGSSVRWVTASDQDPITDATTQALHQLASQIEQDRELLRKSGGQ